MGGWRAGERRGGKEVMPVAMCCVCVCAPPVAGRVVIPEEPWQQRLLQRYMIWSQLRNTAKNHDTTAVSANIQCS